MLPDSSPPPGKTPSSSEAEDYPVWKRWGDLDEHSKSRPYPDDDPAGADESPADALRRVAAAQEARKREAHEEAASHPEAGAEVDVATEDVRSWESDFSALDIRDRVVIMLLFKQIVQIDDVEAAWRRFQSTNQGRSREPLWRILARDPAFDRDRILAEAARSAGFQVAEIDPAQAAQFIDTHFRSFSESDWDRMLRLSVVPIAREKDPRSGRERTVFVAPDPSRPGVAMLLRDLEIDGYILRYAPERLIDSLLADLLGTEPAAPAPLELHPTQEETESADRGGSPPATNGAALQDTVDGYDNHHAAAETAADAEPHEDEPAPSSTDMPAPSSTEMPAPSVESQKAPSIESEPPPSTDSGAAPSIQPKPTPSIETTPAGHPADREAHQLFEECLTDAVKRGATDIHLLTVEDGVRIDMRIDGELERWRTCPMPLGDRLLTTVKESSLNIMASEIDSVQDGTIRRKLGDVTAHFRVSVLPIAGGWSDDRRESVVISMLREGSEATDLQSLGLPEDVLVHLRDAIAEPRGMVVLAGPSGSGRSATLSAILHEIVTPKVNVITLEESVSHDTPDVRQVRLSHKLDHEDALEAVRRHDPDIILVGELRTKEAAELALKLANAGHLVFSRVPAHDSTGVISRLFKLSVDPFLIAYAINLVVAQRLVRRLCPDCKQPARHLDGELLRRLGFSRQEIASTTFYDEGIDKECATCGGRKYRGTAIVAEAMPFTQETRRLIALADASFDEEDVRAQAVRDGMTTIRASARDAVLRGDTSVGELIRSTAGEH